MSDIIAWPTAHALAFANVEAARQYLSGTGGGAPAGRPLASEGEHVVEPVVGDYVTRNDGFKNELMNLCDVLRTYVARKTVSRPLNLLLGVPPGSGRSFFVKQIAKAVPMKTEFDEFCIPTFHSTDAIIGIFQRIQSAGVSGEIPFFLVDQVDGLVENQRVLKYFLEPMWKGVFRPGKQAMELGRAVLVYTTGTIVPAPSVENLLGTGEEGHADGIGYEEYAGWWRQQAQQGVNADSGADATRIECAKDFLDRIDLTICVPPILKLFSGEEVGREQVDIACLLVKKHFENVTHIERAAVLAVVKKLAESQSRRNAETAVFCSNVKDGRTFKLADMPKEDRDQYANDPDFEGLRDKVLRIVARPRAA